MVQLVRSLLFNVSMYMAMAVMAVAYLPWALVSPEGARRACHDYCRYVLWTARWMVGLRVEVRGTPPAGAVLVAAKHQSFLDILVIYHAMPRPRFIMKRELMYAPVLGQYAWRIGCVFVDRGKRGQAIARMLADVARGAADPGQLVIYPQGTRVAPGAKLPYKVGSAVLYQQLGQPCVPVATNVGLFWPKRAILRRPGTAVVEFLPTLPTGLSKDEFMARLEQAVEARSDSLAAGAQRTG
ncbi:MAG: 1-acyl-sn-glycerol-3-phosphate acyltransferase [Rhodobacteraceae bacterium]|jgi:1-acyl-sn-glycerol-3-phosphate acyltransferase|nr:1-acyl-sn-glycerol-3-phosphate acyltransferase [Paracoccaceae bacterium]